MQRSIAAAEQGDVAPLDMEQIKEELMDELESAGGR
jgi:hypothetical protein